MPEFAPGESKAAIAPITVRPSGLNCEAEVFLGPDEMTKVATSGRVPFTSTGVSQDVLLPVTMPATEGTYHVYVDVYAEGYRFAAYQGVEDVVIAGLPAVPLDGGWTCSGASHSIVGMDPQAPSWQLHRYTCTITSKAPVTTTKEIKLQYRWKYGGVISAWATRARQTITLAPGEVFHYSVDFSGIVTGISIGLRLIDEEGNTGGHVGV